MCSWGQKLSPLEGKSSQTSCRVSWKEGHQLQIQTDLEAWLCCSLAV